MHGKLLLALAAGSLVLASLPFWPVSSTAELIAWGVGALLATALIAWHAPDAPVRHGILVGLLAATISVVLEMAFFDLLLARNPEIRQQYAELTDKDELRILLLILGPVLGLVGGVVMGLIALGLVKCFRGRRKAHKAPVRERVPLDGWVRFAWILAAIQLLCFVIPYLYPSKLGLVLWMLGLDGILWPAIVAVMLLMGLITSLLRRPVLRPARIIAAGLLLFMAMLPLGIQTVPVFFLPYPSSHNSQPSEVAFRLPWDGPVTVFWGGRWPSQNYHAVFPPQCWAYDLIISENGRSHANDGKQLEDYFVDNQLIVAPAAGKVHSVRDGLPDMPPGQLGGSPPGGNQIVIEVAKNEYLFLCHLKAGSILVQPGDQVQSGQPIARVGNSGNTSEPHLHIHLQDSSEEHFAEGIPLYFHDYRLGNRLVRRGIPTGGLVWQIVEHSAGSAARSTENNGRGSQ